MNKFKILTSKITLILWALYISIYGQLAALINAPIALAETAFTGESMTVDVGTALTHFSYSHLADNQYTRILANASGLDATFTLNDMSLNSANMLYVYYDGSVSNATLTYQVQIRDFTNSTWRNVIPHATTLANTTDGAAGIINYSFTVYDGYFSNGSGTPVSTPLSNFINGSNQTQVRFLSSANAPAMELRIDYLSVEPAIETMGYPASLTNTAGGTVTNEYNDLTTDDNTTNMTIAANGSGIDAYFSINNMPTPYTGANSIMVEWSGSDDASLSDYSISIRDFTNSQWDTLNGTLLNSATDTTYQFATPTAQGPTDYISGGEIRIRFSSADTSGTLTLDYIRVTIGSTATGAGVYVEEISRGTGSSGALSDTRTLDTTSAAASRVIASSTTDVRATTEYPSDCNGATNNCIGYNIRFPVTVPANTQTTGVHAAMRWSSSSTSNDLEWGIRNDFNGNGAALNAAGDLTSLNTQIRTAAYPMAPQVGSTAVTAPVLFEPEYYVDTVDNAITLYFRSPAPTASANLTIDFAFVSIRYIGPKKSITNAWVPTGATLTQGTNNASNFRYANRDDGNYYSVTPNGTNGTDYYLSFTNVAIPSGSNKIIVDARIRDSAASQTYELFLYDFTNTTWRDLTPHSTNFTSDGTLNTEEIIQIEVYDGYFSNGSDVPVSTPLSNFVSSSEMRLRVLAPSTANRVEVDYAYIEIAKDPVYFPADSTITNGTVMNEYNDTTTDDATTSYTIANSGGIDFYLSFNNVITPPTGSNAVLAQISSNMTAGATSYNVSIRNFNSSSWEALNGTVLTHTSDRTDYFIKSISDWSHYISSGEMRLRFNSAAAGGSIVVDYAKLMLGSTNTDAAGSTIDFGDNYRNTVAKSRDTDTSATLDMTSHTWGIRSFPNNQQSEVQEAPSNIAATINFPITRPTNAYTSTIIWVTKGQGNVTTITPSVSFMSYRNGTRTATNNQGTMTTVSGLPNAVNTITYNIASETFREGWYIENTPQAFKQSDGVVGMRIRTTASTLFGPAILSLDTAFAAIRYVD